jgi:hypothetical protein
LEAKKTHSSQQLSSNEARYGRGSLEQMLHSSCVSGRYLLATRIQ